MDEAVTSSQVINMAPTESKIQELPQTGQLKEIKFVCLNSKILADELRLCKTASKSYICMRCNKNLKTHHSFQTHMKFVHSSESPATCDICDKTYKTKHYLHLHSMRKHYSEIEKYGCHFCLLEFKTKRAFYLHMKRIHPMIMPEYKCLECGKQFKVPYKLRFHIKVSHKTDKKK